MFFELFQGLTAKTECRHDNFIASMTPLLLNVVLFSQQRRIFLVTFYSINTFRNNQFCTGLSYLYTAKGVSGTTH